MSQEFKSRTKNTLNSQFQEQTEDLDIRLERQIFLSSELQKQLNFCRDELSYGSLFQKTLAEERERISKHYLFNKTSPFGGWQNKLKQLTVAAISNESVYQKQGNKENKNIQLKEADCSQKKHLEQILADKEIKNEEEQIHQLQSKVDNLYEKIGEMVMEEYMNDKILVKIKRQAKKMSKVKTLSHIEKQASKYKNWVEEKNKKINNEVVSKQVEEKIIHNLEYMKLLMNKKIINNDYIYEQFEEKNAENTNTIDKIDLLCEQLLQKYAKSKSFFIEKLIEGSNEENIEKSTKKHEKKEKPLNLLPLKQYIKEVQDTLGQIDSYEAQNQLQQQSKILNEKLNELTSSFKK